MDDEIEKTDEIPILDKKRLLEAACALSGNDELLNDLDYLTAKERAWVKWFSSLSETDKKVVEICGESGVTVTPANFDQAKAIVKKHCPDI